MSSAAIGRLARRAQGPDRSRWRVYGQRASAGRVASRTREDADVDSPGDDDQVVYTSEFGSGVRMIPVPFPIRLEVLAPSTEGGIAIGVAVRRPADAGVGRGPRPKVGGETEAEERAEDTHEEVCDARSEKRSRASETCRDSSTGEARRDATAVDRRKRREEDGPVFECIENVGGWTWPQRGRLGEPQLARVHDKQNEVVVVDWTRVPAPET